MCIYFIVQCEQTIFNFYGPTYFFFFYSYNFLYTFSKSLPQSVERYNFIFINNNNNIVLLKYEKFKLIWKKLTSFQYSVFE